MQSSSQFTAQKENILTSIQCNLINYNFQPWQATSKTNHSSNPRRRVSLSKKKMKVVDTPMDLNTIAELKKSQLMLRDEEDDLMVETVSSITMNCLL